MKQDPRTSKVEWQAIGEILVPRAVNWQPSEEEPSPRTMFSNKGLIHVFPRGLQSGQSLAFIIRHKGKATQPFRRSGTIFVLDKSKHSFSQTRQVRVEMGFDHPIHVDRVLVPYDGSPLRVRSLDRREVVPVWSAIVNLYLRGASHKKEKIVSRLTLLNQLPSADIHTTLLANFRSIFSVDTNTSKLDQNRVCITSICEGAIRPIGEDRRLLEFAHRQTFIFPETEENSEARGWLKAIAAIESYNPTHPRPCLLVVDSNLDHLDAYNRRELPLAHGEFLPQGWLLMYAGSDAGTREFLPNGMIAGSHRASDQVLEKIRTVGLPSDWPTAERGPETS